MSLGKQSSTFITQYRICLWIVGGVMEKLDSKYILSTDAECPDKDPSAATLGLTNMAGGYIFIIADEQGILVCFKD